MIRSGRSRPPSWSRTRCESSRWSAVVHAGGRAPPCLKGRSWSDRIPICSIWSRAMRATRWTMAERRTRLPDLLARAQRPVVDASWPRVWRTSTTAGKVLTQLGREGEGQRFIGQPLFTGRRKTLALQEAEHAGHELVGDRGTTGHSDTVDAVQPAWVDLAGVVDPMSGLRAGFQRHLHEPYGVGGVRAPDHDDQVGVSGDLLDGELSVLSGVADIVAGRIHQQGKLGPQPIDGLQGLIDTESGLAQPRHTGRIWQFEVRDLVGRFHHCDVVRRLTRGAFDLLMTRVPDEQNVQSLAGEPLGLLVHLCDQRTGGVDHLEAPRLRLRMDGRRNAVRGEDHRRALRHLRKFIDEDGATALQILHHMTVVDDLLADIDAGTVHVQRLLHRDHRTIDTRAVAPRGGDNHPLARRGRGYGNGSRCRHGTLV